MMAFPASKVTWVLKVTGARSESLVPGERMVLKGQRDALDPLETLGPLGSWATRESWVFLVCLVILDARVPRGPWDFLVFLEPVERRVPGACLGSQDHGANGGPRVHEVSGVPEVPLGSLELREHRVVMALMGPPEKGVSLGLRAPTDFLAPKDLRAPLGRMGCQDTQAREEKWVFKGRLAPLVPQEWWGLREQQEKLGPWGREVIQAPQDLLESRD